VLLLLATFRDAVAVNVDVENGVYKLQEATFDTVVKKFPAVMVKFYAPWCGHCKAMAPAYEKAARRLKKAADETSDTVANPRLAKVDATVEKDLAKKYEVQGFPTLMVFKDGEMFGAYHGGRDKDDLVSYMQTFSLPMPVGALVRAYYVALGVFKDIVRAFLPGKYRKYATFVFPILLITPSLLLLSCLCCCGGGGGGKKRGATGKKQRGRAASKEGEEEDEAKADGTGEKEAAAGGSSSSGLQKRKGRSASPAGPSDAAKGDDKGEESKKKSSDDTKEE